jgi:hypothetical protein
METGESNWDLHTIRTPSGVSICTFNLALLLVQYWRHYAVLQAHDISNTLRLLSHIS